MQNDAFNRKHGAVKRSFQHGDSVYAKVHRANSWQWEPATVIEKVGSVIYNVFLEDQHRLIRSHANQLKTRVPESSPAGRPTPLSIFFDGFGLPAPAEVPPTGIHDEDPAPQQFEEPLTANRDDSYLTEDFSEDEAGTNNGYMNESAPVAEDEPAPVATEEPVQPATPILERGRRIIQLPARFKPFWMMNP